MFGGMCGCCDCDLSTVAGVFSPDVRAAADWELDSCSLLLLHVPSLALAGAVVHLVNCDY